MPFAGGKVKMLEIHVEKLSDSKYTLKKLTDKFPDFKANILSFKRK